MVVIRLARSGSKKNPFYNVVVADKHKPRDGRFIERIGFFDPMARGNATRLSMVKERVQYWVSQGAQPSMRVSKLIKEFEQAKDTVQAAPNKAKQHQAQKEQPIGASAEQKTESVADEPKAAE